MAGPFSPSARLKSLKNDFGLTRGANSPNSFLLAIYDDSPEFGGTELTEADCPGYARVAIDNDDFAPTADNTMLQTVALGDATGDWTRDGRVVVLLNAAAPTELWDYTYVAAIRPKDDSTFDPVDVELFYSDDSTTPS